MAQRAYSCTLKKGYARNVCAFTNYDTLKGQVHGLAHVHESNYFFSDLLVIISVNNPTHMYLSDHIL